MSIWKTGFTVGIIHPAMGQIQFRLLLWSSCNSRMTHAWFHHDSYMVIYQAYHCCFHCVHLNPFDLISGGTSFQIVLHVYFEHRPLIMTYSLLFVFHVAALTSNQLFYFVCDKRRTKPLFMKHYYGHAVCDNKIRGLLCERNHVLYVTLKKCTKVKWCSGVKWNVPLRSIYRVILPERDKTSSRRRRKGG